MKKVLLSGDSWGFGAEYKHGTNSKDFFHTKELFVEHDFTNVSRPGSLNSESISEIENELSKKDYDAIFWIQTDPIRDVWIDKWAVGWFHNFRTEKIVLTEYAIEICSTINLVKYIETLLFKTYSNLNKIAEASNKKIYCLGGCSMLHPEIRNYTNLIPIIPSIAQFLESEFTEDSFIYDTYWMTALIQYADTHKVNKIYHDNLCEVTELFLPKSTWFFKKSKYFNPLEDPWHPSKEGLMLWVEQCKKYIN
jgi:hypothetical protein